MPPKRKRSATPTENGDATSRAKRIFPASSYRRAQINPLPTAKNISRTDLKPLVFGTGDMGQHGLGVELLEEISRARFHEYFETNSIPIIDIEAGGMHTLAIDANNKVYSWGINDNAALGRVTSNVEGKDAEELETTPLPVQQLDPESFRTVAIAAGDSISLALSDTGELRAWGSFRGSEGLLGFDRELVDTRQFIPVKIANIDRHPISSIACGSDHVLALTTDGTVFVFGNGEQQQLGRRIISRRKENGLAAEPLALKNIKVVGAGAYHSFAVNDQGRVYAWGLNSFRQTGISNEDGSGNDVIVVPTEVKSLDPSLHGGARVISIKGGEHHSVFLFSNGEVWGCGRCDGYEVGLAKDHAAMVSSKQRREDAKKRQAELRQDEEAKILSGNHNAPSSRGRRKKTDTTSTNGEKETDGDMNGDAATNGNEEEEKRPQISGAEAAAMAAEAAAKGIPIPNDYIPQPTLIAFPTDAEPSPKIVQIGVGSRHSIAVSETGLAYGWGLNGESQLGTPSSKTDELETPTLLQSKDLKVTKIVKATTGGQHSFVLGYRTEAQKTEPAKTEAAKS